MDRRAWQVAVPGVSKSQAWLSMHSHTHTHTHTHTYAIYSLSIRTCIFKFALIWLGYVSLTSSFSHGQKYNFSTIYSFTVKTWNRDSIIQYISIDPKDANEFQKYQCVNKIWVFRIKITKQFHSQAINYEDRGGEKRIHLSKLWKLCWTGNPFLPSFNHYNLNLMLEWFLQI